MDKLLVKQFEAQWTVILAISLLVYEISSIIYNLYFHPLSKFPGPWLARSTLLWRLWYTMNGRHHHNVHNAHAKYGHVFRVSPNELSFASLQSYKDIYGYPAPGSPQCIKSDFYDIFGNGFKTGCIGSERDPKVHALKKKNLLAAFSAKALASQEDIIQRCIDVFVSKIGPISQESSKGIDLVEWFEMSSFDLLGEMAFGESFGCIQSEKHHFWIDLVLQHVREITLMDNLRRFRLFSGLAEWILPSLILSVRAKHTKYTRAKVQKRLESTSPRQDFLTNVVGKVKSGDVPLEEMAAHSSTLIIAGGETTATTLSAVMFYLLKSPKAMEKLKAEIRGRYKTYDEIHSTSALQLPYLQATINEALRIHPSGAHGFPRISPGTRIDGYWIPKGTEIYTSTWSVSHSAEYFNDPDAFLPERWIDPDTNDIKEASQPFSLGYRACIGRSFAYLQMSLVLSKIIYKYDIKLLNEDLDWEAQSKHYVMWWKAPIRVRASNRLAA
ncbi:putative cytochrome P450 [Xylariaceae sp. FL1272]|nr:putative cytochrome P450 [Xylariaceae sp. FL1272]